VVLTAHPFCFLTVLDFGTTRKCWLTGPASDALTAMVLHGKSLIQARSSRKRRVKCAEMLTLWVKQGWQVLRCWDGIRTSYTSLLPIFIRDVVLTGKQRGKTSSPNLWRCPTGKLMVWIAYGYAVIRAHMRCPDATWSHTMRGFRPSSPEVQYAT